MKIGYARVSTQDQNIDLQMDALKKYECAVIYQEKKSGKNSGRPELKKMLQTVREGDVLVIWKLDRPLFRQVVTPSIGTLSILGNLLGFS
jgi:DNA invertase Pin-like site-specific DNA recombinase